MDFNHWDIIVFIPLALAGWKGFRKGLIIELASIAALIAGIYIAANFSELIAHYIIEAFEAQGTWVGYVSFIITFAAVVFGVYALAKIIERAVNLVALKLVNKLAGACFGLIKMALILSIILNVVSWFDQLVPVMTKSKPEDSLLFEPVLKAAPTLLPVLTESNWMKKTEKIMTPLFEASTETTEE